MLFKERQQIAIPVAAMAVMGCFVLLRYLPLNREISTVKRAKAAQMLVIARGEEHSKQLPLVKEQVQNLRLAVGNYESSIPGQRAVGPFLRRIADLMNDNNLKKQAVTPGEEIAAGELKCIPVDMQCRGRLEQVFRFHRQLRNLDRLIRIERVKFVNDGDFGGEVLMETRGIIYYRPPLGQG